MPEELRVIEHNSPAVVRKITSVISYIAYLITRIPSPQGPVQDQVARDLLSYHRNSQVGLNVKCYTLF